MQAAGRAKPPARTLIVDDEELIRRTLRGMLAKAGYAAQTAGNGEEALSLLKQQPFDLILLDLNMPRMDGMAFLRTLRRRQRSPQVLIIAAMPPSTMRQKPEGWGSQVCWGNPCCLPNYWPRSNLSWTAAQTR